MQYRSVLVALTFQDWFLTLILTIFCSWQGKIDFGGKLLLLHALWYGWATNQSDPSFRVIKINSWQLDRMPASRDRDRNPTSCLIARDRSWPLFPDMSLDRSRRRKRVSSGFCAHANLLGQTKPLSFYLVNVRVARIAIYFFDLPCEPQKRE